MWNRSVLCHAPDLTGHWRARPSDKQRQQQCSSQGRARHRIRQNDKAAWLLFSIPDSNQSRGRVIIKPYLFFRSAMINCTQTATIKRGVGGRLWTRKKSGEPPDVPCLVNRGCSAERSSECAAWRFDGLSQLDRGCCCMSTSVKVLIKKLGKRHLKELHENPETKCVLQQIWGASHPDKSLKAPKTAFAIADLWTFNLCNKSLPKKCILVISALSTGGSVAASLSPGPRRLQLLSHYRLGWASLPSSTAGPAAVYAKKCQKFSNQHPDCSAHTWKYPPRSKILT